MNLLVTRAAQNSDFEISLREAEEYTRAMEAVWQLETPPQAVPLRVGELKPYQRLIAQRNALLRALIRQVRRDKKLSAAPAILAIMTALADNEHGRATISNERLSRVLGRDRSNIERCISALRDDGFLMREPVTGTGTVTWLPVVEFDLTTKPHEMVQALAPATASQIRAAKQLPALIAGSQSEVPAISAGGISEVPATNAGSSATGTRAQEGRYPRSPGEVPALDPYNNDEFVGELDTNTALNNTAKKNTAGAQARSSAGLDDDNDEIVLHPDFLAAIKIAREAEFEAWSRLFTPTAYSNVELPDEYVDEVVRGVLTNHGSVFTDNDASLLPDVKLAALALLYPQVRTTEAIRAIKLAKLDANILCLRLEALADWLSGLPADGLLASSEQLQRLAERGPQCDLPEQPISNFQTIEV